MTVSTYRFEGVPFYDHASERTVEINGIRDVVTNADGVVAGFAHVYKEMVGASFDAPDDFDIRQYSKDIGPLLGMSHNEPDFIIRVSDLENSTAILLGAAV